MTKTAEHPAQKYLNLREKNLAFFKQYYPGIYEYFVSYQMQHAKVDILPEQGEIDLIIDGKHLYSGQSTLYAKKEVATFLSHYDYGSTINSFRPLARDAYKNQRFFARSISKVYDYYYSLERPFSGYHLEDLLPLVVIMGGGLGRHVEVLCKIREIQHMLVFEDDMDRFAATFYSVDWSDIVSPFLADEARSFTFILVPGGATEDQKYSALWNHLIKFCPLFPATTLFYNHLGSQMYDRISEKVNSDIYVHLYSFGNFDDEVNQLNNAIYNFKNRIPILQKLKNTSYSIPVCIVGSGPSLDERIEDLKSIADKAIIFSSGTALRPLWKHGIKPDFQIELESDFNTYATQNLMEDKAFIKSVTLVGAAQLNPLLFQLFGDARIFFKDDGPLAFWFGSDDAVVKNATPTCTNAALALAFHFEFPQVLLFGMDYGFPSEDAHHASGAVYYKDEMKDSYKVDNDVISVPAAAGGTIKSTPFLFTSKRRIDNLLYTKGKAEVFNCSNGAQLDHTVWLPPGEVENRLFVGESDKQQVLEKILSGGENEISYDQAINTRDQVIRSIEQFCGDLENLICDSPFTTKSEFIKGTSLFSVLMSSYEQQCRGEYYFIRGAIWHFLLAGYSMVMSLECEDVKPFLDYWRQCLLNFIRVVPLYCREYVDSSSEMKENLYVNQSIWAPESEQMSLYSYDWEALDVVIDEDYAFHSPSK